jgi:hypothetical protein
MTTEKKGVLAFLKEGFNELFTSAETFEAEIAQTNKWWETVTNDTFEIGEQVFRKPSPDDKKAVPKPVSAGEYELKDGSKILTDSEGIIRYKTAPQVEVPPAPAEPVPEPAPAATPVPATEQMAAEPVPVAAPAATPEATPATPEPTLTAEEIKALQAENATLKAEIATLKAEKVKAETALETMKKQTPAARFVKDMPPATEAKEYKDMTNAEKMRFNRENKKY